MIAVTVSREFGSGGTAIAKAVARRLGARYLSREIFTMALQMANVGEAPTESPSPGMPIVEVEEIPSLAGRIVEAILGPIAEGLHLSTPPPPVEVTEEEETLLRQVVDSDEAYRQLLQSVLEQVLEEGSSVVIGGRGGQALLRGRPGVLHVHISAPLQDRVRRVMAQERCGQSIALEIIERMDRQRHRYLRRYFGVEWRDPALYHLMLNSALLGEDNAVELIVTAARMLER